MQYKARVLKIVDGDTFDVFINLGFDIYISKRIRLYGINCPEIHGPSKPEGDKAKARVEQLIAGKDVTLHVEHPDKYGRILASVIYDPQNDDLTATLLAEGLGVPYYGDNSEHIEYIPTPPRIVQETPTT